MKNILLIGGSTGIGYELSKKLVDNNNVFISTRNTEIFNGTDIKSHVLIWMKNLNWIGYLIRLMDLYTYQVQ